MSGERSLAKWMGVTCSLMIAVWLVGCSGGAASMSQVEQKAAEFFEAIKSQNYDEVLTYYGDDFFEIHPKESWRATLEDVHGKLGALTGTRLKESQVSTIFSGTRYLLVYANQYQNGPAIETLVFFQALEDEQPRIVVHEIDSARL